MSRYTYAAGNPGLYPAVIKPDGRALIFRPIGDDHHAFNQGFVEEFNRLQGLADALAGEVGAAVAEKLASENREKALRAALTELIESRGRCGKRINKAWSNARLVLRTSGQGILRGKAAVSYRTLRVGETTRPGDEFLERHTGTPTWRPCNGVGIVNENGRGHFRRKLAAKPEGARHA